MNGHFWEKLSKAGSMKYVLLVAAAGLLLLLWPSGERVTGESGATSEETRLEAVLTAMEGVGAADILLSESGAVVVCEGADSAGVCLRITQAVRCYTGLGADNVQIFKMK